MARLKLTIAYVGTNFHGWQIQACPHGAQPTIQEAVMRAFHRVLGQCPHVHGAGRTDAGVHARGQVAHVDVPDARAALDWRAVLNAGLPPDIRIVRAEAAAPDFHAQRDAVRKTYEYRLWLNPYYTPPHLYPFVWGCGPLDEERMRLAAGHFAGERDFASLRNRGTKLRSTRRTVTTAACVRREEDLRVWRFEADGFLKQMVRNMVGLLVRTGQGKLDPAAVPDILAAANRRNNIPTAPARGLCLERVWYADGGDASYHAVLARTLVLDAFDRAHVFRGGAEQDEYGAGHEDG